MNLDQGGRRQINIGVAIIYTKLAARLCLLHKSPNIGMAVAIPAIPPAPSLAEVKTVQKTIFFIVAL